MKQLPTQNLLRFIDKMKDDYSDASITSALSSLTEDEIYSLRNFVNAIDTHTYDRIMQIDDEEWNQELKLAQEKKYIKGL
tara:strand:- start:74 stop:313 length:240 start_codon:yes stop_codon:yes gene_type:complete